MCLSEFDLSGKICTYQLPIQRTSQFLIHYNSPWLPCLLPHERKYDKASTFFPKL